MKNDPTDVTNLFKACASDGCFYLDLMKQGMNCQSCSLLAMAERVFNVADTLFKIPLTEKLEWEMDKLGDLQICGYVVSFLASLVK